VFGVSHRFEVSAVVLRFFAARDPQLAVLFSNSASWDRFPHGTGRAAAEATIDLLTGTAHFGIAFPPRTACIYENANTTAISEGLKREGDAECRDLLIGTAHFWIAFPPRTACLCENSEATAASAGLKMERGAEDSTGDVDSHRDEHDPDFCR
jgi:hypothetical protein